jgi:hypothetical protein
MARLAALTLAVTLLLVTFALRSTDAIQIQCYECTSAETSGCGDPFAKSHSGIRTCNGKTCTKAKASTQGVSVIRRGCSQDDTHHTDHCKEVTEHGATGRSCSCSGNLCNAARPLQASLYATALLATVGAAAAALRALY